MSQFNPIERIGIHRSALIFLEQFGWIEREQPISDMGIDMHVEIVNEGVATGQIFAIQIKSGKSYFEEETESGYIYRGKNRHLEYWLSQSLPVLILIYEPDFNSVFWQLVSPSNTTKTEKGWKMEIPKKQLLDRSKDDLRKIYHNPNHYVIMHVGDNSHAGARRVEAKILVESTHAKSRIALKKMIPEITQKFKQSDYHRNQITKDQYEGKQADVVFLFFYDSIQHVNRGLTFCRAIWNDENCEFNLTPFSPDEEINDIQIIWDNQADVISDFINESEFSKGEYLDKADELFNVVKALYDQLCLCFEQFQGNENFQELKETIISKESEFDCLIHNSLVDGLPPLECKDLDQLIQEASALIHNIWIVISDNSRDNDNVTYLIDFYLKQAKPKIDHYNYELQKVK